MISHGMDRIFPILCCPACRVKLDRDDSTMNCPSCGEEFEIIHGVPVLLMPEAKAKVEELLHRDTGTMMVNEYTKKKKKRLYDILRPPDVHFNAGIDLAGPSGDMFYGHDKLVLNIGGGPTRFREEEITLNIGRFPNVDLIADAHAVPLPDGSVDTVICNAVLEHVLDPNRVVSEIYRILKPGGKVYAEIPFLWFYHGYPGDFWRCTRDGILIMMEKFQEVETGITQGPTGALLQLFVMYFLLITGLNHHVWSRKTASFILRWLLFPLRYIDLWLNKKPDSHTLAGGFYFIGEKGDRT